jgi:hypothetical protein
MPPVGFETTISAGERPQTYAIDRAATGTGTHNLQILTNVLDNKTNPFLESQMSHNQMTDETRAK